MFNSQSQFSTFGWWVAWIYLLSLTGLLFVPAVLPPPPLPSIEFAERGITVTRPDGTVIEEVTATVRLSEPARTAVNVTIDYVDNTAVHDRDFTVTPAGKVVHFDAGEQEQVVRFGHAGRDVEIVGPTRPAGGGVAGKVEDRSFIACLRDNPALQPVGDTGRLAVTILRAERTTRTQPVATYTEDRVEADERDLPGRSIAVGFDKPLPEPATMTFTLFRTGPGQREEIGSFRREVPAGEQGLSVRLEDVPRQLLEDNRALDDRYPEADEHYELAMMSSEVYPGEPLALTARNDDGPLEVRAQPARNGDAIRLVDTGPDWREAGERWWDIEATLPDGETIGLGRGRSGGPPIELPAAVRGKCRGRRISVAVKPCRTPDGEGGSNATGRGCCRGGGCPGGQGNGSCGGGSCLVGPSVPGDYLLVVVNNERLHERGNTIVERVRKALADDAARPYGNGAIIVNPADEDTMTATGGGPSKDKMFRPFERQGEDVAAQQRRVEEVIARKREAAERPDLRAVVVWPERDLASGAGLEPVAGQGQQPVSFLFPGADPSYARTMRPLVPPKAPPGAVTIRSPKEEELTEHLINIIRETAEASGIEDSSSGGGDASPPPRDVDEALGRTTG